MANKYCWARRGHFANKQFLSICVCAVTLQFASATTWEPTTHECSLIFPETGWTFQEGANVTNGHWHLLLTALNRDHTKSVNLLSIRGTRSGSVQDPGFSANFKRGFVAAGSRAINDGYTNLNGHVAYWLNGEKTNNLGQQASTLTYSLFEGRTLYNIHAESLNTVPVADDELLTILASFQVHGEPPLWRRFSLTGNSIAFYVGIIVGAAFVFRLLASIRLKKRQGPPTNTL
jgi:hypothetical protein